MAVAACNGALFGLSQGVISFLVSSRRCGAVIRCSFLSVAETTNYNALSSYLQSFIEFTRFSMT